MPETHLIKPDEKVKIEKLETRGKKLHQDRERAEAEFHSLRNQLAEMQNRMYAEGKHKLLVVLQAMDAGGKDSTIRKVFQGVNPQGCKVTSFKKPTDEELDHDFLWRIHKAVPGRGMIGIFNRSHYEDVLVVRVHDIVPKSVWQPRYEMINEFEEMLSETGTTIIKFFLNISKEEQKERFEERLSDPSKHWKFDRGDLDKRKLWDDYMEAFEDMLNETSTKHAPWYAIPADQKWYRNLAISRVLIDSLEKLNIRYPEQTDDLSGVVIE